MRTTWASALTWRLDRHLLGSGDGSAARTAEDVVARLIAVPAWTGDADLAVRLRMACASPSAPAPGVLAEPLADGRLVKVFTFRGATHLMTPALAADHLALRAAGRMWERRSWTSHYGLEPEEWPSLRAVVRDALAEGPLTPEDLGERVAERSRFAHLRGPLSTVGTFLKPFFWQGDVCFGPSRDGRPTLQRLDANPGWPGIPALEEAGPRAVSAYLSAYGPATAAHVQHWLGDGLGAGRRRIERWLGALDGLVRLEVDGEEALVPAEHADALAAARPAGAVRLLPGLDQWVLGPGTADPHVVPPARRPAVTRGADLVLLDGLVAGTWTARAGQVEVTSWVGRLPADNLAREVARLERLLA
ncbi:DNA glycosylase AlkZ-like family protein [Ornithinimicrobium tianjinense]|uniref:DNA glycosylase AlkZ-like family protein n=1 Tax=Ornithinimicrobium tianjinense TaxID=1195761 RepID=UPI001E439586|nr:crosslink repair DNA glycosylase YcaQ family protein [Ornithinimicrobium tianjinense]